MTADRYEPFFSSMPWFQHIKKEETMNHTMNSIDNSMTGTEDFGGSDFEESKAILDKVYPMAEKTVAVEPTPIVKSFAQIAEESEAECKRSFYALAGFLVAEVRALCKVFPTYDGHLAGDPSHVAKTLRYAADLADKWKAARDEHGKNALIVRPGR